MTCSNVARTFSLALFVAPLVLSSACASRDPSRSASPPAALTVDQATIVAGVRDDGRDPAVIALDIGGQALCTGTLLAPDVVLTARHCVSFTTEVVACPAAGPQITGERPASSLRVLVGEDVASAKEVARGRELVVPPGDVLCDADIALVILDREVDEVNPFVVGGAAPSVGDHVTAIGFGKQSDNQPPGVKLLREHVEVLSTSPAELVVGEATCQGDSGGPALDEQTGEIVGIVSRGGPTCDGPDAHNVYTRTDVFASLIDDALSRSLSGDTSTTLVDDAGADASDAGKRHRHRKDGGTSGKPKSDVGKPCTTASDCSTGLCLTEQGTQYCSRTCGPHDRCPSHYRCTATSATEKVCIAH